MRERGGSGRERGEEGERGGKRDRGGGRMRGRGREAREGGREGRVHIANSSEVGMLGWHCHFSIATNKISVPLLAVRTTVFLFHSGIQTHSIPICKMIRAPSVGGEN